MKETNPRHGVMLPEVGDVITNFVTMDTGTFVSEPHVVEEVIQLPDEYGRNGMDRYVAGWRVRARRLLSDGSYNAREAVVDARAQARGYMKNNEAGFTVLRRMQRQVVQDRVVDFT